MKLNHVIPYVSDAKSRSSYEKFWLLNWGLHRLNRGVSVTDTRRTFSFDQLDYSNWLLFWKSFKNPHTGFRFSFFPVDDTMETSLASLLANEKNARRASRLAIDGLKTEPWIN